MNKWGYPGGMGWLIIKQTGATETFKRAVLESGLKFSRILVSMIYENFVADK
jgi:hypothetical protein